MNNNENVKEISVDQALKLISQLHFERFKARLEGDEEKENAFNEEINRLSKELEEAVKELENEVNKK